MAFLHYLFGIKCVMNCASAVLKTTLIATDNAVYKGDKYSIKQVENFMDDAA